MTQVILIAPTVGLIQFSKQCTYLMTHENAAGRSYVTKMFLEV
jgi:hypothetical protein